MYLKIEIKRHRFSVTQGEVEVFINEKSIIQYGDNIELGGKYGEILTGYGSTIRDEKFALGAINKYLTDIINEVEI